MPKTVARLVDPIVAVLAWLYKWSRDPSTRRLYPLERCLIAIMIDAVPKEIASAMALQMKYYNHYERSIDSQIVTFLHIERFSVHFDHAYDLPLNTLDKVRLCSISFRTGTSQESWHAAADSYDRQFCGLAFNRPARPILRETDIRILRVKTITRRWIARPGEAANR
ncbi:MAG: hypothetical protein WD673_17410 [Alphaproteobacteria bacterium]